MPLPERTALIPFDRGFRLFGHEELVSDGQTETPRNERILDPKENHMTRTFRTLSFALLGLVAAVSLARAADHVYVPSGQWPTSWVDVVDPEADTLCS